MRRSERGSVLFYILITAALFATLAYAVSQMMRGGAETVGNEKTGLYASDVLEYAKAVRTSVQSVRISNGCTENQISFERSPFDGSDTDYVNASAPSDFSCHIFHPVGGGASPLTPLDEVNDGVESFITGHNTIPDVGTTLGDLVLIVPNVSKKLCLKVNDMLAITNPSDDAPTDADGVDITKFDGSYSEAQEIGTSAQLSGQLVGCYKHTQPDPDTYNVYQVLWVR